jgi:D-beta-D-heptose 7-phosphate kinase/D-beta-D-heptose 1-phosphate adenosyltransferase
MIQLPAFEKVHVLVIGDVMLDRYWKGSTGRISPEAPVPIVHVNEMDDRPGGAGNVALNLRALGVEVSLMGMVGEDKEGDALEALLTQQGIHCYFQRTKIAPTITKLRVVSQHQQLLRLDFEEKPITFSPEKQLESVKKILSTVNVVVLSDYNKGVLNHAEDLIAAAKVKNIPVLVDPKKPSFSYYAGASIITPNMKEFQEAVGKVSDLQELEKKAREALDKFHLEALLITRSEHGMSLIQKNKEAVHIPTRAKEVFDVTGAGDTVIAVMAAAIAAGESWTRAMVLSNVAAGISISKLGAATVSPSELRRALTEEHLQGEGIVTESQLKILVQDAKDHGEVIVMTNGCFDLLHAGHVAYLEEAKKLGDRLIVAVNDDDSVRRLKGPSRPLSALKDRMSVLAGLKSVDWVVSFSEDMPERIYAEILPSILVKGGDYKLDEVAGGKAVIAAGGIVKILQFKQGISTSNIIRKARGEA